VGTAPKRRAKQEKEKKDVEMRAFAEAERKATEEREATLESIGQARVKKYEEKERAGLVVEPKGAGCLLALFCAAILMIFISII
jgi:hypothetical protein